MDCNHSSSNRSITKSSSKLIETVDENCSKQCCFSLPFIVTKKILSHLNYYQMLQLRLVCKYWQSAVDDYIMTSNHSFLNKFLLYRLEWVLVKQQIENYSASMNRSKKLRAIPKMSARIHFLSCCVDDSLYIFGGCGNILRCYNDLWRFDIENKMWHRIIPEGDLPLPRLYASFNYYEQCDKKTGEKSKYIVLYGGISQFRRNERKELEDALDTIHLFDINQNRWRLVSIKGKINLKSSKHFATIIGDELIVSGGRRYANGKKITKEAIYVFDLKKQYWRCQYHVWSTNLYTTNSNFDILNPFFSIEDIEFSKFFAPNSFVLDDHHILYVGFSLDDVTDSKTFLLELNKNHTNTCDKCTNAYENGTQSSCTWIWHPIDINLRNFDFTSGQFYWKLVDFLIDEIRSLSSIGYVFRKQHHIVFERISLERNRYIRSETDKRGFNLEFPYFRYKQYHI
ncbi:hypothetical protein SSS_03303 [Sarcoptes scabiei]|nr:hypothetical protein SSS_03303 [Sarcoptes scabiei]